MVRISNVNVTCDYVSGHICHSVGQPRWKAKHHHDAMISDDHDGLLYIMYDTIYSSCVCIITDRQTQSQMAIGYTHSVSAATPSWCGL